MRFRLGHAAQRDQVVILHDLGADKAFLQVGVDHPGSFWRGRAARHRPGPALVFASGKEGLQPSQIVGEADHPGEAGLFDAVFVQEHLHLIRWKLRNIHLELALQAD